MLDAGGSEGFGGIVGGGVTGVGFGREYVGVSMGDWKDGDAISAPLRNPLKVSARATASAPKANRPNRPPAIFTNRLVLHLQLRSSRTGLNHHVAG